MAVEKVSLGYSKIIPKGHLGHYTEKLFWAFKHWDYFLENVIEFDRATFYKQCRRDWEWGDAMLTSIIDYLESIDSQIPRDDTEKYNIQLCIRYIRQQRNGLRANAVEREIFDYIKVPD